jgi:DnaK suppressor protein
MTDEQRAHLEQRLLEERERAVDAMQRLAGDIAEPLGTSAGDLSKFPSHLADLGADVAERERDQALAEHATALVERIDDALTLLREDPASYGVSRVSGEPIPFERLDLMPWTRVLADEAPDDASPRDPDA